MNMKQRGFLLLTSFLAQLNLAAPPEEEEKCFKNLLPKLTSLPKLTIPPNESGTPLDDTEMDKCNLFVIYCERIMLSLVDLFAWLSATNTIESLTIWKKEEILDRDLHKFLEKCNTKLSVAQDSDIRCLSVLLRSLLCDILNFFETACLMGTHSMEASLQTVLTEVTEAKKSRLELLILKTKTQAEIVLSLFKKKNLRVNIALVGGIWSTMQDWTTAASNVLSERPKWVVTAVSLLCADNKGIVPKKAVQEWKAQGFKILEWKQEKRDLDAKLTEKFRNFSIAACPADQRWYVIPKQPQTNSTNRRVCVEVPRGVSKMEFEIINEEGVVYLKTISTEPVVTEQNTDYCSLM
jgi:hypothetical protein